MNFLELQDYEILICITSDFSNYTFNDLHDFHRVLHIIYQNFPALLYFVHVSGLFCQTAYLQFTIKNCPLYSQNKNNIASTLRRDSHLRQLTTHQ